MVYRNFGKSQNINAMVSYRKQIAKFWTANLVAQSTYQINTSNEVSGEFTNKGSSLVIQWNNNINIMPTLSAEVTGGCTCQGCVWDIFVLEPMGNFQQVSGKHF